LLSLSLVAARYGFLNCLKYAHENGCQWNENTCYVAAENGHLNCLKYAHENGCKWHKHLCMRRTTNKEIKKWIKRL